MRTNVERESLCMPKENISDAVSKCIVCRCRSMDSKQVMEEPSKCSTPLSSHAQRRANTRCLTDPSHLAQTRPWPPCLQVIMAH